MTATHRHSAVFASPFAQLTPPADAAHGSLIGRWLGGVLGRRRSDHRRDLAHVADSVLTWHQRARQRRALMAMSDHMLRDIGIGRAEALAEATKPFWRA
jgi:uncharacterized protein YjiS (DUF1127 family)